MRVWWVWSGAGGSGGSGISGTFRPPQLNSAGTRRIVSHAIDADGAPDEQLLAGVAAGDQQAFATLFRRRHAAVYRFALHMTASAATADDVTQEVFLTMMRDAGRFDPARASVVAWLCGIARNHVRRCLERDERLQPLTDADEVHDPRCTAAGGDQLGELARAERIAALRRALSSLPVRYREAVVLCDLQELTYAEAAHALGCAVGTVRSRLHRGRALLAAKVRDAEQGERVRLRGTGCFA